MSAELTGKADGQVLGSEREPKTQNSELITQNWAKPKTQNSAKPLTQYFLTRPFHPE